MPGSYQHPTWGLGWQSFPVSFSVKDQQVSYLRWYVDDSTAVRTHPAEDYRTAYLMPALFAKPLYPEVKTRSAQQANALVVVRSMTRLHNRAAEIADEWVIHRYDGEVERVVNAAGDREWLVLRYPGCAVAVTALSGICAGAEARAAQPVTVVREEGRIRLRRPLFRRQHPAGAVPPGNGLGGSMSGRGSGSWRCPQTAGCGADRRHRDGRSGGAAGAMGSDPQH